MNPSAPPDEVIELNVSGRVYFVLRSALVSAPGLLQRMFGDGEFKGELIHDGNGRVFLGRDADAFGTIVNFLTTAQARVPQGVPLHVAVAELAYFFDKPPRAYTDDMLTVKAMPEVQWFITALHTYLCSIGTSFDVPLRTLTPDSHITVQSKVFMSTMNQKKLVVHVRFDRFEPWWCGFKPVEAPMSSMFSWLMQRDESSTFAPALQQVLQLCFSFTNVHVCVDGSFSFIHCEVQSLLKAR